MNDHQLKHAPHIPFRKVLPSFPKFVNNPIPILSTYLKEHDGYYSFNLAGKKVFITDKPSITQHILQKNHRNYHKSEFVHSLTDFVGFGLLTSEGDYWLKQRRLIQPGFHRKKLEELSKIMLTETNDYVDCFNELCQQNQLFDLSKEMMHLTLNVITKSLFSGSINQQEIQKIDFAITHIQEYMVKRIRMPFLMPWMKVNGKIKFYEGLHQEINELLFRIIRERKTNGGDYDDLLDMLLSARYKDSNEGMSDKQLRDEALVLFVAGHETSANALTWLWYALAQNPAVEEKLYQESISVLGDRDVTFDDLPNLPYSKQVIDETLRLYPPAWILDRVPLEDDEVDGYHLPKGGIINVLVHHLHRNPAYWEEPEVFNPDRFEKSREKDRVPYSYIPFGGGPRLCIGYNFAYYEMQIIIAQLIRRFRFRIARKKVGLVPLVTLRPKGGMWVRVEERK